ncbi:restriction endonuclease subunit S [Enterococcus faecalis]|uniref:restriction endonuclease subunit S n=2 Tax=Enterococcus TaxID=1350 RepID=UPI000CF261FD|nr:restriction endonuclease subunit S [Enterococcus faecalis]EGO2601253.1 restriction endonuclease subunit S [Enterococcus faecalis]EGO7555369.1 restriction endonuclease subunit S [Enterococcus faecalis]EGO8619719.1 restriction endonuclease subunit S [Enterococcus faecalis]EGO8715669.1 restriction endonuclease subunit S [Enterococcus faecalis]PQE76877.1 restriction endonuclease subunit S [Enterococcus faecalis]
MYFQNPDKVQSNNIDTRTYVMRTGDIAFEGHPNKEFKFGRFVANDIGTGVVSELFPIYRHKQEYDNYYWKNAIQIERVMGPIFAKSITSSGNSSNKLDPNHFLRQQVFIPKLEEQSKIGLFLKKIDTTIALHQRKLDQLKELKKAYLQVMFPVKDERVPKLRLADFEGEWEQCKLGDITKISTGKLDANAMVENGKYDFYTSGIKKYRIDVPAFEGPAITIAGNGATVGYMHLADNKFNAYQRTYVLQEFVVDRSFLFSEVGNKLPKKINQEARTGNIPYIVMDMLTELKLSIPQDEAEQSKIGSFFKQIDKTIALHQNKLEQLKDLKTSYLQNMFI